MTYILLTLIYISFISLGLPDSLLGCAWPTMQATFGVPLSYASYISMLMSVGTIISSLMSDRLTRRFGTGKVTAFSVALTAASLFGYSVSRSYVMLLILAVPNGLGAGGIDAALNNYVSLHYSSRHMSWLHCMWGTGTVVGPYIMGYALSHGAEWTLSYRVIAIIQMLLAVILIITLPVWKVHKKAGHSLGSNGQGTLRERCVPHPRGSSDDRHVLLLLRSRDHAYRMVGKLSRSHLRLQRRKGGFPFKYVLYRNYCRTGCRRLSHL